MGTWSTGTDEFTCKCGARYKAHYKDFPERDKGTFNCTLCGEEVHSWKGTRDYMKWELMVPE